MSDNQGNTPGEVPEYRRHTSVDRLDLPLSHVGGWTEFDVRDNHGYEDDILQEDIPTDGTIV
jgi:hypothetical protein